MEKPSPGPWKQNRIALYDANDTPLTIFYVNCRSRYIGEKEAEANAKLASMAPDMLLVLKEAVDHAHVYNTNPALIELFEHVIKKATNETKNS